MNSRTIDVVTDWETVPTPDGYEGLHQLADREFSGAVSAGMTWAFFLNGRVVGVFEGDIGSFEDAELTAYRAADSSLPLLFAMRERGGETRASYYTNDTPLSDADRTLSEGGFTGYIELSENVLSGDYYVVYHGGKSMSAAFVGSAERLVTGEEAFETAADEVGIYKVIDVDVDVVDLPELEETDAAADADEDGIATPSAGADDEGADEAATPAEESAGAPADEPADGDSPERETAESDSPGPDASEASGRDSPGAGASEAAETEARRSADAAPDGESTAEPAERAPGERDAPDGVGERPDDAEARPGAPAGDAEPATDAADAAVDGPAADPEAASDAPPEPAGAEAEAADPEAQRGERTTDTAAGGSAAAAEPEPTAGDSSGSVFPDEERWREAQTIPSLDPNRSNGNGAADADDGDADRQSARERVAQMQRQRTARREARTQPRDPGKTKRQAGGDDADGADRSEAAETKRLKKRLSRTQGRIKELESERDELQAEVERLRTERSEYRDRIEELEAEHEELNAEIDRLEAALEDASEEPTADDAGESMSPDRALAGTNLFVRYDRKGEATLEHAHDGEAAREDVGENLRLEHHTTFETEGVTVDGRPYEEFLRASTEYSFAEWVVTDLLYEIGETGNRSGLAGVFDAIPEIDRVELDGTVDAEDEAGETRDFDVIFRNQMGDPLFVADLNASRNATTEAMVGSLVGNTGAIAADEEALAAGFYVTKSFYEPGALETVAEETGGGLLSRSKKLSYVKLSRKRGYHLCLVEARNGDFHLNVPDL